MLKRLISRSKAPAIYFLWVIGGVFLVFILFFKLYLLFVSSSAPVLPYFYMVILYLMLIAIYQFKISAKIFYKFALFSFLFGVITFIIFIEFSKLAFNIMFLLLVTAMVKEVITLDFVKRVKIREFVWLGVFLFLLVGSSYFYWTNRPNVAGKLIEIAVLFVLVRLVVYFWRFRQPDHK
ncbi:MAG: hypothetical protein ACD_24C00252G0002 [uncultured bacterium]|uniref:Uncharacterized protein n=1 Tax=Candidatus Woesebacteria bacterium RIFCSPLOWO2_01_FULL_39_21 TaxID=1802519 RepID=A0A1F8BD10_9BACT|nr:MAG: hypothetical protein ACD_24C00252G0002 [uncultured bacterium]OGM23366.1 MAG: hypothetical protein A2691_04700 [Candidatus Woesebacteria bacterium RIFCSPHIGHO2_01_FULL_39_23]OGM61936.1 MAG: hypothetical protein A2961_02630 [Candidatus Woesebacteria bacterium RIFCSPLOWO2_01_FULL_39_21]